MNKDQLLDKILAGLKSKGQLDFVAGALGDTEECEGFVEEVTYPKEGGKLTKFYGVDFLFKGYPEERITEGLAIGKALYSYIPTETVGKSLILKLTGLFMWLFARKTLIHCLRAYTNSVCTKLIDKLGIPETHYNGITREIKRTVWKITKEISGGSDEEFLGLRNDVREKNTKLEKFELIRNVTEFFCLFIEHDNAYRFRFQDIVSSISKEEVEESVYAATKKIFDILIERDHQVKYKWILFRRIVLPAVFLFPSVRRMIRKFFLELDFSKVTFDEHDRFFCLNRSGYDFFGVSYLDRLEERKRIDRERGHSYIQMFKIKNDGKDSVALKVVDFKYPTQ